MRYHLETSAAPALGPVPTQPRMVANHAYASDTVGSMPQTGTKAKEIHTTMKYYGGDPGVSPKPTIIGGYVHPNQ